jgi:hypothetical protein
MEILLFILTEGHFVLFGNAPMSVAGSLNPSRKTGLLGKEFPFQAL